MSTTRFVDIEETGDALLIDGGEQKIEKNGSRYVNRELGRLVLSDLRDRLFDVEIKLKGNQSSTEIMEVEEVDGALVIGYFGHNESSTISTKDGRFYTTFGRLLSGILRDEGRDVRISYRYNAANHEVPPSIYTPSESHYPCLAKQVGGMKCIPLF
jgi:hypothetical protein